MKALSFTQNNQAGLGDYLTNLNLALLAAEYLNLNVVELPNKLSIRCSHDVFEHIGLHKIINKVSEEQECFSKYSISLIELYQLIKKQIFLTEHDQLDVFFESSQYKDLDVIKEIANQKKFPKESAFLRKAITNSSANQQAQSIRSKVGKNIVVIHVRRGDIAILEPDIKKEIILNYPLDTPISEPILYANDGRFYSEESFAKSAPHSYRYRSTEDYLACLQSYLKNRDRSKSYVVLISDGFDKLAKRIISMSKTNDQNDFDLIVSTLEKNLEPIKQHADYCVIGENNNTLLESLSFILAADVIIYGPSSFPVTARKFLNTNFVCYSI
jgi:hypothetical protein